MKKKLYKVWVDHWEANIVASNTREARILGVNYLEQQGLIHRKKIKTTDVQMFISEVWVGA
jgi:hypothetical protein